MFNIIIICFIMMLSLSGVGFNAEMLLSALFFFGYYSLNFLVGEVIKVFLSGKINKIFKRFYLMYSINLKGIEGWLSISKLIFSQIEKIKDISLILLVELTKKNINFSKKIPELYRRIIFTNIIENVIFVESQKIHDAYISRSVTTSLYNFKYIKVIQTNLNIFKFL